MGSYRGRRTVTDVLRVVAVLLAILVAFVLAGLLFGQSFIVYGDNGLRLDLPFFSQIGSDISQLNPDDLTIMEQDSPLNSSAP